MIATETWTRIAGKARNIWGRGRASPSRKLACERRDSGHEHESAARNKTEQAGSPPGFGGEPLNPKAAVHTA